MHTVNFKTTYSEPIVHQIEYKIKSLYSFSKALSENFLKVDRHLCHFLDQWDVIIVNQSNEWTTQQTQTYN